MQLDSLIDRFSLAVSWGAKFVSVGDLAVAPVLLAFPTEGCGSATLRRNFGRFQGDSGGQVGARSG